MNRYFRQRDTVHNGGAVSSVTILFSPGVFWMQSVKQSPLHKIGLERILTQTILALSLVHLLEIIGEAANSVSADFRDKHPHIPWRKMIGMRNRLIHCYFDINLNRMGYDYGRSATSRGGPGKNCSSREYFLKMAID